jgi:ankyrin repeat protein
LLEKNPRLARHTTPMGNTPLHVVGVPLAENLDVTAATEMIQLLLRHGADPQAKNNEGLTPRQWQRKLGNDEVAELLP